MKIFNPNSAQSIRKMLAEAVADGEIEADDTVWLDDGGEYVVDSGDFFGVDTDDLSDSLRVVGKVSEYLD